jgi:hypothetical protein
VARALGVAFLVVWTLVLVWAVYGLAAWVLAR